MNHPTRGKGGDKRLIIPDSSRFQKGDSLKAPIPKPFADASYLYRINQREHMEDEEDDMGVGSDVIQLWYAVVGFGFCGRR